jgi:glycerol uptake facilitator-like aquaporin
MVQEKAAYRMFEQLLLAQETELEHRISKRLLGEFIGSHFLTMTAISATILGYNVLGAGIALTVFMDAIAVGFVLFALIETFGPICQAHFNPALTLSFIITKNISYRNGALYMVAQFAGGLAGLLSSHLMFYQNVPTLFTISTISRNGGDFYGEFLGTFILILVIYGCIRRQSSLTSLAVGMVVAGLLITTSSTMFANPQVTLARMFTYAIAGVAPVDGIVFIVCQVLGALLATAVAIILFGRKVKCPNVKIDSNEKTCSCNN